MIDNEKPSAEREANIVLSKLYYIFACVAAEVIWIEENLNGLLERHTVSIEIGLSLPGIPLELFTMQDIGDPHGRRLSMCRPQPGWSEMDAV